MDCEGLVTRINPRLGYFEVEEKFKIYLNIHNEEVKLPVYQTKIVAKHLHKYGPVFVACKKSTLEGNFKVHCSKNPFTDLIKDHKLGANDIIMIDKTLELLNKNFLSLQESIIVSLFNELIKTQGRMPKTEEHCSNNIIAHIRVNSISACRYIEVNSNKFESYPSWSFGIHYKPEKSSVLFGHMFIHPLYGFLMLEDVSYKMTCIITNKDTKTDLNNSFVLIKNYKVITEIFQDSSIPNLEYLIVDFSEMVVLSLNFSKGPKIQQFKNKRTLILYRKSSVCLSSNQKSEIYFEIMFLENSNRAFLTLSGDNILKHMDLKEGFKYNLHHNWPLKPVKNELLTSVEQLNNYVLQENAYFEEIGPVTDLKINEIIPISRYKDYVSKNSGLFSLEAVVFKREFIENYYPEVFKRVKIYGFTTPGTQIHTVDFENEPDHLNVYLSNWINRLMPLGLVPEMRVIIRNVCAKSIYVKPTIFTWFEIISYEPKISFQTANLFEFCDYNWGQRYYLSKGNKIPPDVTVWSKISNVHVVEVKMCNSCKNCGASIKNVGSCVNCRSEIRNMTFELIMYVWDEFGTSRITVNNPHFFKIILDLAEKPFSVWFHAFEGIGEYSYDKLLTNSGQYEPIDLDVNIFRNLLTQAIQKFNGAISHGIEIKCRKKIKKGNRKDPEWLYLDARRIS